MRTLRCPARRVSTIETDMQSETIRTKRTTFTTKVVGRTLFVYYVWIFKQSSLFLSLSISLFPFLAPRPGLLLLIRHGRGWRWQRGPEPRSWVPKLSRKMLYGGEQTRSVVLWQLELPLVVATDTENMAASLAYPDLWIHPHWYWDRLWLQ